MRLCAGIVRRACPLPHLSDAGERQHCSYPRSTPTGTPAPPPASDPARGIRCRAWLYSTAASCGGIAAICSACIWSSWNAICRTDASDQVRRTRGVGLKPSAYTTVFQFAADPCSDSQPRLQSSLASVSSPCSFSAVSSSCSALEMSLRPRRATARLKW